MKMRELLSRRRVAPTSARAEQTPPHQETSRAHFVRFLRSHFEPTWKPQNLIVPHLLTVPLLARLSLVFWRRLLPQHPPCVCRSRRVLKIYKEGGDLSADCSAFVGLLCQSHARDPNHLTNTDPPQQVVDTLPGTVVFRIYWAMVRAKHRYLVASVEASPDQVARLRPTEILTMLRVSTTILNFRVHFSYA